MRRGSPEDRAVSLAGANLSGSGAVTRPLQWACYSSLHPEDPRSSLGSGRPLPLRHCCLRHHIFMCQPGGTPPHALRNSAPLTPHPGGKASWKGNRKQECDFTMAMLGWDPGSGGLFSQEGPDGWRVSRPPALTWGSRPSRR